MDIESFECLHENYIEVFPEAFIHRKYMSKGVTMKTNTITIKICKDCNKILEIRDFGE